MTPLWHPSPSFGPRRGGVRPDIVVLHYTAMRDAGAALERLCDPGIEVSAHYLVGRDGTVWHLVDEAMRAWHAGAGAWGGCCDVNSRSIGIELDNTGAQPFSEPLMAALEALLPDIMARWSIPPERVIAHSDLAPERKSDPGAKFDWARLGRQGLAAAWPVAGHPEAGTPEPDERRFRAALDRLGYPACAAPHALRAFRLRHRPQAEGALNAADLALAEALAARFPVDRKGAGA